VKVKCLIELSHQEETRRRSSELNMRIIIHAIFVRKSASQKNLARRNEFLSLMVNVRASIPEFQVSRIFSTMNIM
jgi:hypothetical protein